MTNALEIKDLSRLLQPMLGKMKISSYKTKFLVPAGENYGGIILKLDLYVTDEKGCEKSLNLVAKLGPASEMLCKMFNIQHTFKREMIMYTDVIPALIKFQKDHGINEESLLDLFPKCFGARMNLNYTQDKMDNDAVIVFENLQTLGYKMEDRMVGFDLSTSEALVRNLARFHAIPIAMKMLNPKLFQEEVSNLKPANFGDSFTTEMKDKFLKELRHMIVNISECKMYAAKIVDLVDTGFKFEERFLEPVGQYCTIVHHDLWVNNILILKNKSSPIQAKLIDLQMVAYGSLAHDLLFLLYTSVEQDIFNQHYENLIKAYYDSFISCLLEFNVDVESFSWETFLQEIDNIGPHQISHIVIMLRPIFMEKDSVDNMADMKVDDMSELRKLNKKYADKLKSVILDFVRKGWL